MSPTRYPAPMAYLARHVIKSGIMDLHLITEPIAHLIESRPFPDIRFLVNTKNRCFLDVKDIAIAGGASTSSGQEFVVSLRSTIDLASKLDSMRHMTRRPLFACTWTSSTAIRPSSTTRGACAIHRRSRPMAKASGHSRPNGGRKARGGLSWRALTSSLKVTVKTRPSGDCNCLC